MSVALQVDAQLLAFFVKVASFQAKRLRGLRDVSVVPLKLFEDLSSFELQRPVGQRGGIIDTGLRSGCACVRAGLPGMRRRQCQFNRCCIDLGSSEQ